MALSRHLLRAGVALALCLAVVPVGGRADDQGSDSQTPDNDDGYLPPITLHPDAISGIVKGPDGPEAGVWVIAETTDLPTKYAKIVVTDDQGRFVLPQLPKANYQVWVRGYGLVDSDKVPATPGKMLRLTAVPAPTPAAAAQYYPAIYWYSMLEIPDASLFPGTGPQGNNMSTAVKSQGQWLDVIKTDGCVTCHQLGNLATRTLEPELGHFDNSESAWERRIESGQASRAMVGTIGRIDTQRALQLFADWTDKIAAGALPTDTPPRPQGVERNIVITLWDWADPKAYLHDEISTDKRNPTLNAYGLIYGSPEESSDDVPVLDPVKNVASRLTVPYRDKDTPTTADDPIFQPSPYWGSEPIWNSHVNIHNPMFDGDGRVWFTARIRGADDPAYCKAGSDLVSAKLAPLEKSQRQAEVYDPKTGKFSFVDLCFDTHHLEFANDADNTLWFSSGGGGDVLGWLDTKKFLATGDAAASQGWTSFILDTNGNGQRDDAVGIKAPVDPAKDKQIGGGFYGIGISPVDGSVWGSMMGYPGGVARVVLGSNPPATARTEYYEVPNDPKAPMRGFSPRGMDIDSNGVVWVPLASGHLASFDRRKCNGPLSGPKATGKQCPEGWTLYPMPGPHFKNADETGSAEAPYYVWVDRFNTFGLGNDVPIATGNENDALLALVNGKWVILRVPYPMSFYAKGLDGRIDDASAGWKGRGLWSTYGLRPVQHIEGGKGQTSKVVHFQLRPDPLAD